MPHSPLVVPIRERQRGAVQYRRLADGTLPASFEGIRPAGVRGGHHARRMARSFLVHERDILGSAGVAHYEGEVRDLILLFQGEEGEFVILGKEGRGVERRMWESTGIRVILLNR